MNTSNKYVQWTFQKSIHLYPIDIYASSTRRWICMSCVTHVKESGPRMDGSCHRRINSSFLACGWVIWLVSGVVWLTEWAVSYTTHPDLDESWAMSDMETSLIPYIRHDSSRSGWVVSYVMSATLLLHTPLLRVDTSWVQRLFCKRTL